MQEALFAGSLPARLTVSEFRRYHLQSFPALADEKYDELISNAIEEVYTMFSGVQTLFDWHDRQTYYDKTVAVFRLLTAWYITDIYPAAASGVVSMGGIPLSRKKIGSVDISFNTESAVKRNNDYLNLLSSLKSNAFGNKAYLMISSSGKRTLLRNCKVV